MAEYKVNQKEAGKRLDKIILNLIDKSRNQVKKLIEDGEILINNERSKPGYKVKKDDKIKINYKKAEQYNETIQTGTITPEPIDLDIIYEDENIIIINKPRGMVVHPAPGNKSNTLVNALLNYSKELSTMGGHLRPGIVHRLDKDTTGIMLIAKNDTSHEYFKEKFKSREIFKDYLALCYGDFPEGEKLIEAPIGRHPVNRKKMAVVSNGRPAITKVKILTKFEYDNKFISYLKITPVTGRTHQIRVHLSHFGYPLLGDEVYGKKKLEKSKKNISLEGQALHAFKLQFYHPYKKEMMVYRASLPDDLYRLIRRLNRIDK